MARMVRGRAALAAAGVLAVVLSGCTGDADAGQTPSSVASSSQGSTGSSTSASSTTATAPTTTPTAPATVALPPAARAHTDAGAEAFAKFYFEAASRGAVTADSKELSSLSSPRCVGCAAFVQLIDGYRAAGQRIDRTAMTVSGTVIRPAVGVGAVGVDVTTSEAAKNLVDANGAVVKAFAPSRLFFETTCEWASGGWTLTDLKVVQ